MPEPTPNPAERYAELAEQPEFDLVSDLLTDIGRSVLPNGSADVLTHWCISALPSTARSTDGLLRRAFTLNAGRMEIAWAQIREEDSERWLLARIYVRRSHFVELTGLSVAELFKRYDRLGFDPDVDFKAAELNGQKDALRIGVDLTDHESVEQLDSLPWRESARLLTDHLRKHTLMPRWSEAHSHDLADLIISAGTPDIH